MALDKQFPVYGDDGIKGTLFAPARFLDNSTKKRIRLDDGREIMVPAESLVPAPDGSFYLRNAASFLEKPTLEPPAPVEPVRVDPVRVERTRVVETARLDPVVRVTSKPEPALEPAKDSPRVITQHKGEPLFREDCDVKRVPIRRLIDKPVEARQEGDTWIVPLVEEVLIVEKKLLLREELHITRRREQRADAEPIRWEDLQMDGK
jgi:hypothetical protein